MKWRRRKKEEETIIRDYVLPDFVSMHRGEVQLPTASSQGGDRQKLRLGVERFATPELLFHPSDIEIPQAGVAEAIAQSLSSLPLRLHHELLKNVVLLGGSVKFPGFRERLLKELRSLSDDMWDEINVLVPEEPVVEAWNAARQLNSAELMKSSHHCSAGFVTRAEYEEHGAAICRKRYANYANLEEGLDKQNGSTA